MSENPDNQKLEHEDLWAVIEAYFGKYYPGILIQGCLILEHTSADGDHRALRFLTNPDMTPWAAKGLLADVQDSLRAESVSEMLFDNVDEGEDDDD